MDELSEEAEIIRSCELRMPEKREDYVGFYNTDSLRFWNAVNEVREENPGKKIQKVALFLGAGRNGQEQRWRRQLYRE